MLQGMNYQMTSGETLEFSVEGFRNVLGQIESDLQDSDVYKRVMASLQTLPAEVSNPVQRMVQAIGKEAIRLAFRRMVRRQGSSAAAPAQRPTAPDLVVASATAESPDSTYTIVTTIAPPPAGMVPSTEQDAIEAEAPVVAAITPASPDRNPLHPPAPEKPSVVKPQRRKRLSKKEQAAVALRESWEQRLQELGQKIRQSRQSKGYSIDYLHLRTQIPLHQLEALEAGDFERLPEDIYIRGFLRRVGDVLGVGGITLAEYLPKLDPVESILPSWYRPKEKTHQAPLHSVHLYLGYVALLAGGMTWISHQSAPKAPVAEPAPNTSPANLSAPPTKSSAPMQSEIDSPRRSSAEKGVKVSRAVQINPILFPGVAPPELALV